MVISSKKVGENNWRNVLIGWEDKVGEEIE